MMSHVRRIGTLTYLLAGIFFASLYRAMLNIVGALLLVFSVTIEIRSFTKRRRQAK